MSADCFAERVLSSVPGVRFSRHAPSPRGPQGDLESLCRAALAAPVSGPPLAELSRRARRIVVIVSDESRDEPRPEMLAALFEVLPRKAVEIVVAAGTHTATDSVVPEAYRDRPIVVHDAQRSPCVELGTTREGTPVRILGNVAEADLVVVTGRIRPHYFAGYSGGVKGLFPGCAAADCILKNHLLKADPTARLGRTEDNRCRLDMEDAASRVPGTVVALNVLADCDGAPQAVAFGDAVAVHRHLVSRARSLFTAFVPRSSTVIVADRPPVTRSLYQASKLLPPAGAVLESGGTVIVVAECTDGIEPAERVNEGIYRLGVARSLPSLHRVLLVSELPEAVVRRSYAEPAADLAAALRIAGVGAGDVVPVVFRAGEAIVEALDAA